MSHAVGFLNSAHTYVHCQIVFIERPSDQQVDEADVNDDLLIAEIDGLTVLLAASDGCTFFKWAVKQFARHERRDKDCQMNNYNL